MACSLPTIDIGLTLLPIVVVHEVHRRQLAILQPTLHRINENDGPSVSNDSDGCALCECC